MNDASSPTLALSACCGVETVVSLDGGSASWARGSATERGLPMLRRAADREGDQPVPGRVDLRRVLRRAARLIAHARTLAPPVTGVVKRARCRGGRAATS